MKINESGRSMIEMLGVLSIIGVLSTSGIALYSKAMEKRKLSVLSDQVVEIANNIHNVYMSRRNYCGLDMPTKTKDKHKLIPTNMWKKGKNGNTITAQHILGGEVEIGYCYRNNNKNEMCPKKDETHDDGNAMSCGQNAKYFKIAVKNIDKKACISIVSSEWPDDTIIGIGATAGATSNKYIGANAANAATECTKSCSSGCTVSFIMR